MAIKKAVAKPKFKTYIKDFTIRLDPLTLRGSMVGVRKSDSDTKVKYTLQSPDGNPVEQKYQDTVNQKLWASAECDRVFESAGEITTVDKATLDVMKAVKLPENVISLTVHDAAEVDNSLFVDKSNGYIFFPDPKDPKNFNMSNALLAAIANAPDKAFIGVCNFHGYEGLYRVSVWRGNLVFQKHLFPSEINDHEIVVPELTNDAKVLRTFFDKKLEKFNPDDYRNTIVERQREILDNPELLEGLLTKTEEVPTDGDISDLLASLEDWA